MLEVYFYIRSSFTTVPLSLNNDVVGIRDFDNASSDLLVLHVEGPPRLQVRRGCNHAGAWYCSEPTSVLQTSKPIFANDRTIGQWDRFTDGSEQHENI